MPTVIVRVHQRLRVHSRRWVPRFVESLAVLCLGWSSVLFALLRSLGHRFAVIGLPLGRARWVCRFVGGRGPSALAVCRCRAWGGAWPSFVCRARVGVGLRGALVALPGFRCVVGAAAATISRCLFPYSWLGASGSACGWFGGWVPCRARLLVGVGLRRRAWALALLFACAVAGSGASGDGGVMAMIGVRSYEFRSA